MLRVSPIGLRAWRPVLFCAAALAATGCKTAGSGVVVQGLRPADDGRSELLAEVTIAPPDRLARRAEALAARVRLAFTGRDMETSVAARLGLPPEALGHLDRARPWGLAAVGRPSIAAPDQAVALSARDPQAADALVALLGAVEERRGATARLKRPDGASLWIARHGPTVIAGATHEGLVAAGALAVEAQRDAGAADVIAVLRPPAYARWRQRDASALLAEIRQDLRGASDRLSPAEAGAIDATVEHWGGALADARAVTLSLALDPERGLVLAFSAAPRPGTALERRLRDPAPVVLDPALLAGDGTLAALSASGALPFPLDYWGALFAAQARAGVAAADAVRQAYVPLRRALTGAHALALRSSRQGALALDAVFQIAPGISDAAALDALSAFAAAPGLGALLGAAYGSRAPTLQVVRGKTEVSVALAFPRTGRRGDPGATVEAMFGAPTLTLVARATGGKLVVASDPNGATRAQSLLAAARPAARPPGDLGRALDEAQGYDGIAFLQVMALLRPAVTALASEREARLVQMAFLIPGLSDLQIPVLARYRGRQTFDAELRVPLSSLDAIGGVLGPLSGLGLSP